LGVIVNQLERNLIFDILNFLRKIFLSVSTNRSAQRNSGEKDELIGLWENDLDDGSGLHAIWGWSFRFNEDGSGTSYYWSEQKLQSENQFLWSRISPSSIKAKYSDDEEWIIIEYTIKIVDAPYSGKLIKLTDNNYTPTDFSQDGFWGRFGAIFKTV
jgi:hypothetical protein